MKRLLVVLVVLMAAFSSAAFAQVTDSNGRPIMACVPPAGVATGTFLVGDGAGALNTIVDSGSLTCNAGTNLNTSALALDVTVGRAQGSATSGQTGPLMQGAATIAAPSYGTTQTHPLSLDLAGNLRVIGSMDVTSVPSPQSTTGNGTAAAAHRVTIASDSTGQVNVLLPNEGQQTAANSISVTPDTDNDFVAANGAAPPTGRAAIGGLTSGATAGLLQSFTICDQFVNVNIVTATTVLLATGVSGRHVRICSLNLIAAGADNVALLSGTGATCGTGTTGMTGGTTAATGWNFAANGGIAQGTGFGEINRTNATGDSVCIITSAAVQLSGRMAFAIY